MGTAHASRQCLRRAIRPVALAVLMAGAWGCDRQPGAGPPPAPLPSAPSPADARAAAIARKEKALTDHLAVHPEDVSARLVLANLYYDTQRPHLAVPAYIEVLKRRDEPGIRTDLGTCYKRMGLLDMAQAEYERVLRKQPGHLQATFNLAVVCDAAGDLLRAAALWEGCAALAPDTPFANLSLKHAAAARKEAAEAKTPNSAAPSGKDATQ